MLLRDVANDNYIVRRYDQSIDNLRDLIVSAPAGFVVTPSPNNTWAINHNCTRFRVNDDIVVQDTSRPNGTWTKVTNKLF